jgi:hypothetical protein
MIPLRTDAVVPGVRNVRPMPHDVFVGWHLGRTSPAQTYAEG